MTTLTELECSVCGSRFDARQPHNLCSCGGPLLARYDLDLARRSWSRDWIPHGPATMWRYAPVLPVDKPASIVSLGEGMTPLTRARRLGERMGASQLWIKDEAQNPTGSVKARGLACAISMAVELEIRKVVIPSEGNGASATAAYAAAAGIEAHVFMPRDVPRANYVECQAFGAQVTLVDGSFEDCARLAAEGALREGWFDLSALREPYRVEGQKTLGYEVAEQMNWQLPGAILYPTGSGTGLAGIWKALQEMEALGWIAGRLPKMISVHAHPPRRLGEALIARALKESGGIALAVSGAEMLDAGAELASQEGIFAAPEGAACVAAARKLLESGFLASDETIVICSTGAGLKSLEAYAARFPRRNASEADKLGGLITPR
jgi:threonine synthase